MNYFGLPPHIQLRRGLLMILLASIVGPYIIVFMLLSIAGASLGKADGWYQTILSFSFYAAIVAAIAVGYILPTVRMLRLSHRFAYTYGRGDEHVVFYIGTSLLFVGAAILASAPESDTFGGPGSMTLVIGLCGIVLGLLLSMVGLALLYRLSARLYPPTPKQPM